MENGLCGGKQFWSDPSVLCMKLLSLCFSDPCEYHRDLFELRGVSDLSAVLFTVAGCSTFGYYC